MLQNGWRAYHGQIAKKGAKGGRLVDESGVPENSILNEPLFYKAALSYAQMRAESVNGSISPPSFPALLSSSPLPLSLPSLSLTPLSRSVPFVPRSIVGVCV